MIIRKKLRFCIIGIFIFSILLCSLILWGIAMTPSHFVMYGISEEDDKGYCLVSSLIGDIQWMGGGRNKLPVNIDSLKMDSACRKDVYYSPNGFEDNNGKKWEIIFNDKNKSRYIGGTVEGHGIVKYLPYSRTWFKDTALKEMQKASPFFPTQFQTTEETNTTGK